MSTGPAPGPRGRVSLLSFQRPRAESLRPPASTELENCTNRPKGYSSRAGFRARAGAHRQETKGTWRMPWHQESKKDVDGCDKPR